jgi:hypothetical protein
MSTRLAQSWHRSTQWLKYPDVSGEAARPSAAMKRMLVKAGEEFVFFLINRIGDVERR